MTEFLIDRNDYKPLHKFAGCLGKALFNPVSKEVCYA
jgi:hypothetical protein